MTGKEKLAAKFNQLNQKGEKALITFITAGDPDLPNTVKLISTLKGAGADIIELGVPFSDPVADGPVIQRASARSLAAGTNLRQIIQMVADVSDEVKLPLVLMSYYNPILQYGLARFCSDAANAGLAGIIIPDLPFEESRELISYTEKTGLAYIPLVTPTTNRARLELILSSGSGFVYCVTVTGVTGTSQDITGGISQLAQGVRALTGLPIVAGFGIATPQQAYMVAEHCDGVVVGSALVKLVEEMGDNSFYTLAAFTQQLKQALLREQQFGITKVTLN